MATQKKAVSTDPWKRKRWFKVFAPRAFNQALIGESPATEVSELIGRNMVMNLMALTGNSRNQGINLSFKVVEAGQEGAQTMITSYKMMPTAIKRIVRKGKTRIDDAFLCKTADGKLVRLKPLLLTTKMVKRSLQKTLRKEVKAMAVRQAAALSYDRLFLDVVAGKFQKGLREKLNKIYPLAFCEIRNLEITVQERYREKVVEPQKVVEKPAEQKKKVSEARTAARKTEAPSERKPTEL